MADIADDMKPVDKVRNFQINFGPQGMKWLQLEYAKLQAA